MFVCTREEIRLVWAHEISVAVVDACGRAGVPSELQSEFFEFFDQDGNEVLGRL